jgi:hypothetical protein
VSSQVQVLEEVSLVTPLGVRFWDVATASPAEAGLTVVAYPDVFPELRATAVWNGAGVYSFSGLPGLRRAENGAGDAAYWSAVPSNVPYTIEVSDPANRYLPFELTADLPVRGLYALLSSPMPSVPVPDPTWVPLFSAPARPAAGVSGMVRADLQGFSGAGAAWAMVTAQPAGLAPAVGIADDRGVISLPLAYPEFRSSPAGSPLGMTPLKLTDQNWPVEIRVFFTPGVHGNLFPNLASLLQQPEALIWRDTADSAFAATFTLQFGNELVLRSLNSATGRDLPYLLVTAPGSPL